MAKRIPLWQRPVSYAAVGATQAADLSIHPPPGYRPFERRTRIGHGDARWDYAWMETLTWGIQRNSGFAIELADAPAAVTDQTYVPVAFDEGGVPVAGVTTSGNGETVFASDGAAFVVPGDTARLRIPFGPFRVVAPARVVYVIDEVRRKGFAYGTLAGHPESGEEAFIVEQTDDGSVWLEIRSISRPANAFWWMVYPVLRFSQNFYTKRYFRSLSGPIEGS